MAGKPTMKLYGRRANKPQGKNKYVGVYPIPHKICSGQQHKYAAQTTIDGKRTSCGTFETEREAALAIDRAYIRQGLDPVNILKKVQ